MEQLLADDDSEVESTEGELSLDDTDFDRSDNEEKKDPVTER